MHGSGFKTGLSDFTLAHPDLVKRPASTGECRDLIAAQAHDFHAPDAESGFPSMRSHGGTLPPWGLPQAARCAGSRLTLIIQMGTTRDDGIDA